MALWARFIRSLSLPPPGSIPQSDDDLASKRIYLRDSILYILSLSGHTLEWKVDTTWNLPKLDYPPIVTPRLNRLNKKWPIHREEGDDFWHSSNVYSREGSSVSFPRSLILYLVFSLLLRRNTPKSSNESPGTNPHSWKSIAEIRPQTQCGTSSRGLRPNVILQAWVKSQALSRASPTPPPLFSLPLFLPTNINSHEFLRNLSFSLLSFSFSPSFQCEQTS